MKWLLLVPTLLALSCSPLWADYEVRDSKTGVIVVSNTPGDFFSLEAAGKQIKRLESDPRLMASVMVDGRLLQINPVPLADFRGDAKASDDENLRRYLQAESDLYKQPLADFHMEKDALADGRLIFTGDFKDKSDGAEARQQIYLVFRYGNSVMELSSVVGGTETKESLLSFLHRVADTFRSSSQPIELERRGGVYRIKSP